MNDRRKVVSFSLSFYLCFPKKLLVLFTQSYLLDKSLIIKILSKAAFKSTVELTVLLKLPFPYVTSENNELQPWNLMVSVGFFLSASLLVPKVFKGNFSLQSKLQNCK